MPAVTSVLNSTNRYKRRDGPDTVIIEIGKLIPKFFLLDETFNLSGILFNLDITTTGLHYNWTTLGIIFPLSYINL